MFAASRETTIRVLLDRFLSLPAGQVETYDDLSKLVGESVGSSFYPVRKAIALARDQHNVLICNKRTVGFFRTAGFDDRRDMLDGRRGRVRRQALTGLKEAAAAIKGSNPSNAEMAQLTRLQGAFGLSHMIAGGAAATARKISGEAFVEPSPSRDDIPA